MQNNLFKVSEGEKLREKENSLLKWKISDGRRRRVFFGNNGGDNEEDEESGGGVMGNFCRTHLDDFLYLTPLTRIEKSKK